MCGQVRNCWSLTIDGCAAGLIEVREFLARFVDQSPDLADLEAAFADPTEGQHHMQVRGSAGFLHNAGGETRGTGGVRKGMNKTGLGKPVE